MSHKITVEGGKSVRLPTAGKYCDQDIEVTAEVGGVELPELTNPGVAADLLAGKELIGQDGEVIPGSMVNHGTVIVNLSPDNNDYIGEAGYYDTIAVTAKTGIITFTPSKQQQTAAPGNYFFRSVTVEPIPDEYQDVSKVDAAAGDVHEGKTIVDAEGNVVPGTFTIDSELADQDTLLTELEEALEGKASGSESVDYGFFLINNDPHVFAKGTTWEEYINSRLCYSTQMVGDAGAIIVPFLTIRSDNTIYQISVGVDYLISTDGTYSGLVHSTDEIIENHSYSSYYDD